MKYRKFILFSFVLLTFCAISFGQKEVNEFSNIDFTKPQRLDRFFYEVFHDTNAPAGIVFAFNEDTYEENYLFQPQNLTLKDVLNSFTSIKSEYSWSEANGVTNVFPKKSYSILNTQIAEFKFENEYPWKLDEKLIQTKEFQQYIKEKNLINRVPDPDNKNGFIFQGQAYKPNSRDKISINLKNATVGEILNEIVRINGQMVWYYREYDYISDGETYHMYRLEL